MNLPKLWRKGEKDHQGDTDKFTLVWKGVINAW